MSNRNGCPYCTTGDKRKPIPTSGGGELEAVEIIPLPAIDLTTGKKDDFTDKSFWAMNFTAFEGELEEWVPIHCCPMCGRTLPHEQPVSESDDCAHGNNSVQMVRCNNCMSVFPESKTPYDPETLTEYCPICRKDGCLMDVEV